ncbi:MAG: HAD family hydrolase [Campylobacterota bacterium]|nr:HAD family hydrolase [Campylobacterota bacterium]
MKQAYITDLDHTFLRSDLTLSDFTIETWNSKAQYTTLSVATARSYKKAIQFLTPLHINAPMVLLDGAMIVTPEKKIIDLKLLNREVGDAVIDEGAKFGIFPVIISLEDDQLNEAFVYPSIRNTHQDRLIERYLGDDNLMEQKSSRAREKNLKLVYMGEEKLLRQLDEHFKTVFGDSLEFKLGPEAYLGCYYLTVLHPLADKAHGLQTVSEYVGIATDRMSVFGDSTNDLGMFELAGQAIAVQNAIEEVKLAANIILPHTNDEDAVAKYLETIL